MFVAFVFGSHDQSIAGHFAENVPFISRTGTSFDFWLCAARQRVLSENGHQGWDLINVLTDCVSGVVNGLLRLLEPIHTIYFFLRRHHGGRTIILSWIGTIAYVVLMPTYCVDAS